MACILNCCFNSFTLEYPCNVNAFHYKLTTLHGDDKTQQKQSPEVFCGSVRKDILRNFAKFTGKHLCHSLFFNKVAGLRRATLLKKRLWHGCFPVNFAKFLRTPFLQNTSGRLLLYYIRIYTACFSLETRSLL